MDFLKEKSGGFINSMFGSKPKKTVFEKNQIKLSIFDEKAGDVLVGQGSANYLSYAQWDGQVYWKNGETCAEWQYLGLEQPYDGRIEMSPGSKTDSNAEYDINDLGYIDLVKNGNYQAADKALKAMDKLYGSLA